MSLSLIDKNIPIKAMPEAELNKIIITQFTIWLSGLLSLSDEVSAERLEVALPAIKEHCWSMGFSEIKKMFEMYADNKLSIKPIPNYFDRILFGKIVEAYKQQKPVKKIEIKKEMTEEDKKQITIAGILQCFEDYKDVGKVEDFRFNVFDVLYEVGILPKSNESPEIQRAYTIKRVLAKEQLNKEVFNQMSKEKVRAKAKELKEVLKDVKSGLSPKIETRAKALTLEGFFKKITEKNENPKEYLMQLLKQKYELIK